jgi:hypothetical protein
VCVVEADLQVRPDRGSLVSRNVGAALGGPREPAEAGPYMNTAANRERNDACDRRYTTDRATWRG